MKSANATQHLPNYNREILCSRIMFATIDFPPLKSIPGTAAATAWTVGCLTADDVGFLADESFPVIGVVSRVDEYLPADRARRCYLTP